MNWLTWRQYRAAALAGYAALAVIGAFLMLTGMQILEDYRASGIAGCGPSSLIDCGDLASAFSQRYVNMQFFVLFVLVVPVLIGMFWGAPLVARELEHGTHRLAWTQGITRSRWITSKLVIVGASTAVFSTILSAAVTWWSTPLAETGWDKFGPGIFDLRGLVPVAYTLFAFALGVALGALMRRTLPAVFATLAVFSAVRTAVVLFLREHFMAAKTITTAFDLQGPVNARGAWILSENIIDRTGAVIGNLRPGYLAAQCPALLQGGRMVGKAEVSQCISNLGLRNAVTYQPADRYWAFQAIEAAIFVALTALLVAFIIRRVKRLS